MKEPERMKNPRDIRPYVGNPNLNHSDYVYLIGGQASGVLAGALNLDRGYLGAIGCALLGLTMGTAMLLFLLVLIGQPPSIYTKGLKK